MKKGIKMFGDAGVEAVQTELQQLHDRKVLEPKIPSDPVADLIEVLNLESLSETEFVGRTQWMPHGRVFGGQVLAQCLVAAQRTVAAFAPPAPDHAAAPRRSESLGTAPASSAPPRPDSDGLVMK